ncbi:MAG: GNAT family N-acetyltransferase [Candidatus Aenigmarchaeota archaeon]|nr:GNAT family N-acetyltransferase [Candidatus Aenigmarchaeota archaeon]
MKFKEGKIIEKFKADGKEIIFRFPKKSDANRLRKYINELIDEKAYIGKQKKVTKKQEIEYVKNNLKEIRKKERIEIIAEHDEKIIGNSSIWKSRLGYREMGIGTKLLELLISMAKKELKARIVRLDVYADNPRAKHVYENIGFRKIGRIPKGCKRQNGRYYDDIIMINEVWK